MKTTRLPAPEIMASAAKSVTILALAVRGEQLGRFLWIWASLAVQQRRYVLTRFRC